MTVLIVEPGKVPRRAEIGNDLRSMQGVVDGSIQAVYPFEEPVALICNEEGKLLNLPKNRFLTGEDGLVYDVVMGTFFLCSAPANRENFESLTEEQIAHYQKVFLTPDFIEKEEAENFTCSHCDRTLPDIERADFDGRVLCARCRSMLTTVCDHCGARIWRDDDCGSGSLVLCEHCRDNYYSECVECGHLVLTDDLHYLNDDDNEGYCDSCWHDHEACQVIRNYYYKPQPIFYGEGKRFLGVELEMDGGGERDSNARQILGKANGNGLEHAYAKHDGSLDEGIELVTHPMTLDYHLNEMPWEAVVKEAISLGYTSHQARTCGLHVHVNRNAFGETQAAQEDVIARILFFVENHWNELLRFSRRTQRQMEQWAARYGRKDDPKAVLDHAKNNQFERYTCVNLTNYNTIEFRMFRGTLKLNTLKATLQIVERICDVALFLSDQEIKNLSWSDFAAGCTAPELVQYLKERRLYVSDPVEVAEEV